MNPWEFLLAVCSGYLGLVVGFHFISRWAEGRRRDKRVEEWTRMVRKNYTKDWESQTMRDKIDKA
tara:strand:- start:191 stop:385 length:195 start_codon:yes stop_codon:yes gene_type:complete